MENNKYYTPQIEEFRIGFEFESNMKTYDSWNLEVFTLSHLDPRYCNYNLETVLKDKRIRVRFLDVKDIESLEWEEIYDDCEGNVWFKSNCYRLCISEYTSYNIWICIEDGTCDNTIFKGCIKNKSELKMLLNMLGINK